MRQHVKVVSFFVFTLENSRLDVGISQEIQNELDVKVGDTNVLGLARLGDLFHLAPAVLHGRAFKLNFGGTVGLIPAGWISSFQSNVLQRYRKVDKIKIDVIETHVLELLFESRAHIVLVMIGVPELGGN